MENKELGIRLKAIREQQKMTQQEVCAKVDIPKVQTLSAYERGINAPNLDTLSKLCKLYNVSSDYLLFGEEYKKEHSSVKDNIRQLVQIVDGFGLPIVMYGDDENSAPTYAAILSIEGSASAERLFFGFVQKWRQLKQMRSNGTIDYEDYGILVEKRLSDFLKKIKDIDYPWGIECIKDEFSPPLPF